jgi:hypothetical protein
MSKFLTKSQLEILENRIIDFDRRVSRSLNLTAKSFADLKRIGAVPIGILEEFRRELRSANCQYCGGTGYRQEVYIDGKNLDFRREQRKDIPVSNRRVPCPDCNPIGYALENNLNKC